MATEEKDQQESSSIDIARFVQRLYIVEAEHKILKQQFADLQITLDANTQITAQVQLDTRALIDIFKTAKSGVNFFVWTGQKLGRFAKWILPILSAVAVIWGLAYTYLHGGQPPMPK